MPAFPTAPSRLDDLGQALGALCLAHCLLLPLLLGLAPVLLAPLHESEAVHLGLTLSALLCALRAFLPGYRRHRSHALLLLAGVAGLLLVAGALGPHGHVLVTASGVGGGLLLVLAHGFNRALCRSGGASSPAEG
jgi:hypothetical protein